MNKKIQYSVISAIIISIVFWYYSLSAEEKDLSWYDLYLERNKQLCTQYKPDKPIFRTDEYPEQKKDAPEDGKSYENFGDKNAIDWNDLEVAKYQYKESMNNIYKCALLNAQERSINLIMINLWEEKEVTALTKQYESKLNRLQAARDINKCDNTNKLNKTNDQKNVIQQTTFEICKYNNYLEYLLEYNSVIANVIEQDKKSKENTTLGNKIANSVSPDKITETYNITAIANLEKKKKQDINDEIERAYKIYPIAFQAYTEYENNLPVHDLLTMLRNDFIEFRLDLHKNLNPINQVVYKISNAMKE